MSKCRGDTTYEEIVTRTPRLPVDERASPTTFLDCLLSGTKHAVLLAENGTGRWDTPGCNQLQPGSSFRTYDTGMVLALCLTYAVPFMVAMYSQVQGKRQRDHSLSASSEHEQPRKEEDTAD